MVGGRRRALDTQTSYNDVHDSKTKSNGYQREDLEAAYGSINPPNPRQRFRDAIQNTIQDHRTAEMKKQLIDNVDHEVLEKYRKSEESVRKRLRSLCISTANGLIIVEMYQIKKGSGLL
jgi:GTPase SAR1 family protein